MYPDVAWNTYCPISELGSYLGEHVTVAGLIIEDRIHRQSDGRLMKFISLCDYSGILECELFAGTYRRFGVQTLRHPIVEVTGKIVPLENGNGFTLQAQSVAKPRMAL